MKCSDTISLRVEPELRSAIEAAADEERRPVASMVRVILEDWIRERPAGGGNVPQPQS